MTIPPNEDVLAKIPMTPELEEAFARDWLPEGMTLATWRGLKDHAFRAGYHGDLLKNPYRNESPEARRFVDGWVQRIIDNRNKPEPSQAMYFSQVSDPNKW